MNEFEYTIEDIFTFPTGTKFKDQEGNTYKISEDRYGTRTLKYPIVSEKILNQKFKIVK